MGCFDDFDDDIIGDLDFGGFSGIGARLMNPFCQWTTRSIEIHFVLAPWFVVIFAYVSFMRFSVESG